MRGKDDFVCWQKTYANIRRQLLWSLILIISLLPINGWADPVTTPTTVVVYWTAPGDDGISGAAIEYDLRYSTTTITESNWATATQISGEPIPHVAGQAESVVVVGLDPDTRYYFAIKAADEAYNWSTLSNVATGVTVDNLPPAAISNLTAETGGSGGELILTWNATGDNGTNGTADHYLILFSQDTITEANWQEANIWADPPVPAAAGETQQLIMSGLDPARRYWVAIDVIDEASNSSGLSDVACAVAGVNIEAGTDDDGVPLPIEFDLAQNFPNPFNPSTRIEYSIAKTVPVTLSVYNILGEKLTTLVSGVMMPGNYVTEWNGCDDHGRSVASGIYLCRIEAGNFKNTKKMLLLR